MAKEVNKKVLGSVMVVRNSEDGRFLEGALISLYVNVSQH
jgi:hypothetical protein